MEIGEVIQLAAEIQGFRPIVETVVEEFKEFYFPLAKQASDYIVDEAANKRVEVYKRYIDAGLLPDAALALTLDTFAGVQKSLASFKQGAK